MNINLSTLRQIIAWRLQRRQTVHTRAAGDWWCAACL